MSPNKPMRRYTKKINDIYCIDFEVILISDQQIKGEAINRLAEFEDFYDELIKEKEFIISQLELSRDKGNIKSATFRQLFISKMSIDLMIERVHRYIDKKKS